MLNKLESYEECGKRAAIAQNQKDEGRYRHESHWLNRALALESAINKPIARAAYDRSYKEARNVPVPTPFR